MTCMLCGGAWGAEHKTTARHQRAAATLTVQMADDGICPYCDYDHKKGRQVPLAACANKDHAATIAYCRRLLVAEQPDKEKKT